MIDGKIRPRRKLGEPQWLIRQGVEFPKMGFGKPQRRQRAPLHVKSLHGGETLVTGRAGSIAS
jgi:hypothetical protein